LAIHPQRRRALPSGSQPPREHENFTKAEKRAEGLLVPSG